MIRRNLWTDSSKANIVDYGISWLMSSLAAYSGGQSVASNQVSAIGVGLVTLGTLFSYFMNRMFREKNFTKIDGIVYCVLAWVAVIQVQRLNGMVFEPETFPRELMPSSWLLWMMVMGSFVMWRDGTLLFQAIPALAMFGFVGCYDTFRPVVLLFFIFLACFATLFARAHARDMQVRAVSSGFFGIIQNKMFSTEDQSKVLREGPWRWAAGAEWALGSALIIVILSLMGAPVIRMAAKPFSGLAKVPTPNLRNRVANALNNAAITSTQQTVGAGPVSLTNAPYFELSGADIPQYLRTGVFTTWSGKRWTQNPVTGTMIRNRKTGEFVREYTPEDRFRFGIPNSRSKVPVARFRGKTLTLKSLIATNEVPQSGNSPAGVAGDTTSRDWLGVLSFLRMGNHNAIVTYDNVPTLVPNANSPDEVDTVLWSMLDTSVVPDQVQLLAKQTARKKKNDWDRAMAIREEISKRIRYNTAVSATPAGLDPAEYALFESKEGYCDVFATSMVLMARSVHIPARYTVGYLIDPRQKTRDGLQLLLESDRHAWAELFFEGVGWVAFDATEGAQVAPGGDRRRVGQGQSTDLKTILTYVLNGLIFVTVLTGGVLYVRSRVRGRTPEIIRGELDREYIRFTALVWKYTGKRRLLSETTLEYLTRVQSELGVTMENARGISSQYSGVMFGAKGVDDSQLANIRQSVQDFDRQLKTQKKSRVR